MTPQTTSAQLPDGLREAIRRGLVKMSPHMYGTHPGDNPNWLTDDAINKIAPEILPLLTPPAAPAVSDEHSFAFGTAAGAPISPKGGDTPMPDTHRMGDLIAPPVPSNPAPVAHPVSDEARKAATPRTDANARQAIDGLGTCVGVNFARSLERELTASQAATAEKQAECERLRYDAQQYHAMCSRLWAALPAGPKDGLPCDQLLTAECEKLRAELVEAQARNDKLESGLYISRDPQKTVVTASEKIAELLAENDRLKQELAALAGDKTQLRDAIVAIKTAWDAQDGTAKTEIATQDAIDAAMSERGKEARS